MAAGRGAARAGGCRMAGGGAAGEPRGLYRWLDAVPLSRPRRNIARDFSDGVLAAEVVKFFFPAMVQLHSYVPASSTPQKLTNWGHLNRTVLSKLNFSIPDDVIQQVVQCRPGTAEQVLLLLRQKIEEKQKQSKTTQRRRAVPEEEAMPRSLPGLLAFPFLAQGEEEPPRLCPASPGGRCRPPAAGGEGAGPAPGAGDHPGEPTLRHPGQALSPWQHRGRDRLPLPPQPTCDGGGCVSPNRRLLDAVNLLGRSCLRTRLWWHPRARASLAVALPWSSWPTSGSGAPLAAAGQRWAPKRSGQSGLERQRQLSVARRCGSVPAALSPSAAEGVLLTFSG
ncbi:sperm flagellar protein 1 isoform X2 [Ciconia boyciana]|uniref:sperm flagellar protein 1 isoform X2 n=1 Tax=Ciconia boyciana TaxID=52775 RepID=UPI003B9F9704